MQKLRIFVLILVASAQLAIAQERDVNNDPVWEEMCSTWATVRQEFIDSRMEGDFTVTKTGNGTTSQWKVEYCFSPHGQKIATHLNDESIPICVETVNANNYFSVRSASQQSTDDRDLWSLGKFRKNKRRDDSQRLIMKATYPLLSAVTVFDDLCLGGHNGDTARNLLVKELRPLSDGNYRVRAVLPMHAGKKRPSENEIKSNSRNGLKLEFIVNTSKRCRIESWKCKDASGGVASGKTEYTEEMGGVVPKYAVSTTVKGTKVLEQRKYSFGEQSPTRKKKREFTLAAFNLTPPRESGESPTRFNTWIAGTLALLGLALFLRNRTSS